LAEFVAAPLHVVAAVIRDSEERILLSFRLPHQDQGGLWEFPGGKVHAGETSLVALRRELLEELGIIADTAVPLITIVHAYAHRTIKLEVWEVAHWRGTPQGLEGQPIAWKTPAELSTLEFPAANIPILSAVRLPRTYLITPDPSDPTKFLSELEASLKMGVRLVQFRAKGSHGAQAGQLAHAAARLCERYAALMLINADHELAVSVGAHGVHLTARQVLTRSSRPLPARYIVGASVHTADELVRAAVLGVDFAVLGPVQETPTHPGAEPLGWRRLAEIVAATNLPIFALGGQHIGTLSRAVTSGCQGIAAIRGLWDLKERVDDSRLRERLATVL
jgi:8-oxo-dGTP diphosphatase